MAGNRKIFEEAMREGAEAAWKKDWQEAITAYQSALGEFPTDAEALTSLASAYFSASQWEAALGAYQRAIERVPDDPMLYERIGQIQETLGQARAAAQAYVAAAERYLSQKQASHLALERWHDAVSVWPDGVEAHVKLLQHYQRQGQVREAVGECMTLARIYNAQGQNDYAIRICQHALKLAPEDAEVTLTLEKLQGGEPLTAEPEETMVQQEQPVAASEGFDLFSGIEDSMDTSMLDFDTELEAEDAGERGTPIEIARQKALADLAESFFQDEASVGLGRAAQLTKAETDALIGKAIDFQTRGKVDEAIQAYEKVVEAGAERPAVNFNLGLLYQEQLRLDEAVSQFEKTLPHPEYTLGSHFALGECYRARGRVDEALEHFVEVVKIVDLATVQREQADDLIQLYESLADTYIAKGEREQASEFTNALVELLSDRGWEDKVVQARQRLDALAEDGPTLSLAELLVMPGSQHILESVSLAQEYAKRGMYYSALEECYYALDRAPVYLPIHRQMAQVLVGMGKVEDAVAKLVVIADTYQMRGHVRPSMSAYQQALRLAPMDTKVRTKLIDSFISHGEIDSALEHYLILADSYYHLAQMDRARETYQEALKLAPRGASGRQWQVRILHKIGDIDMQRVDWKRAIEAYEQIRRLAPEDERARLTLMDLYYRFNRPEVAIAELDSLLDVYRESGKTQRIFTILEDAVGERSDDIPLRTRLAQAHLDSGNVDQALVHLDKLGDLQIEAGLTEDAKATLRVIIRLNPPNVEAYEQVLEQL
jgi:tetratricopeptide (TPR) repeat protein